MRLELGKRYRTYAKHIVKVFDISGDTAMCSHGEGPEAMRVVYNRHTGVPRDFGTSWEIVGLAEPELMFSFKRPGPQHSITISEGRLKEAIDCARRGPLYCKEDQDILADAAERMIEMAKTPAPKQKLKVGESIREQLAVLLREVDLNPDHFLKTNHDAVLMTKETKPMCEPDKNPTKAAADSAAATLAQMLKEDLGVSVTPILLRLWLAERWDRVAKLAHKIHDGAKT